MAERGRSGDKRQRILTAALKVFARKGFFQSKVAEIAREAGVADGTIYLYFRNKDDLLISLFEGEMALVLEAMAEAMAGHDDPVEKIEVFARTHLGLADTRREAAEILQVEVRQSAKFMKEYKNEKFLEYLNIIAAIIREGQARGVIRADIHPDLAKRILFGALDEMARYWVLARKRPFSAEEAAAAVSGCFLRGILANSPKDEPAGSGDGP